MVSMKTRFTLSCHSKIASTTALDIIVYRQRTADPDARARRLISTFVCGIYVKHIVLLFSYKLRPLSIQVGNLIHII